jgi:hypothetical protein
MEKDCPEIVRQTHNFASLAWGGRQFQIGQHLRGHIPLVAKLTHHEGWAFSTGRGEPGRPR